MPDVSTLFMVYVLIVLWNEFILKMAFESWTRATTRYSVHYTMYRLTTLFAHTSGLWLLFDISPGRALAVGALLTALGSTELLTAIASGWVHMRRGRPARQLNLIHVAMMGLGISFSWQSGWSPGPILTWAEMLAPNLSGTIQPWLPHLLPWITVYFVASTPTNFIIRWLMNKPEDPTLAELAAADIMPKLVIRSATDSVTSQVAVTQITDSSTLRAGRVIGTLERWILLAPMARGEMAAIGFIFTAKSIVRYREFDKQEFAEYYLVGTLYSILAALGLSYLF